MSALRAFLEHRGAQREGPEAIRGDILVNHLLGLHLSHEQFVAPG